MVEPKQPTHFVNRAPVRLLELSEDRAIYKHFTDGGSEFERPNVMPRWIWDRTATQYE